MIRVRDTSHRVECLLFQRHVGAYLDGEIDPRSQIELERHVAQCGECQEALVFTRACKAEVKRRLSSEGMAPAHLRARLEAALAAAPPPARRAPGAWQAEHEASQREPTFRVVQLPRKYALPLAAAAVIGMVMGGGALVPAGDEARTASALPMLQDVVRLHSTQLPPDVARQELVSGYFRGKVEFPVTPARFARSPMDGMRPELVGARLSNVRSYRAAALYYDLGDGRRMTVVVFAPPRPMPLGAPLEVAHGRQVYSQHVGGYTVSALRDNGLTYAFTGDVDERTLVRLTALAQVH